jgi:pilus assembly protein CpaC
MHPNRYARRTVLWGTILAAGLCATVSRAQEAKQPALAPPTAKTDKTTGAVLVPLGGVVSFDPETKEPPTDILVSREDVAQVRQDPANPKMLLLTGRLTGLSQMTLTFKDSPKKVYDIVVQPDLNLLRNLIRRTVPTAAVEVYPGLGNVIILSGYVTSPMDADLVTRLATNASGGQAQNIINAIQVGGGQQVQIDVVIARVNRNMFRSRGFDWSYAGTSFRFDSVISGLLGVGGGVNGGNMLFRTTTGDSFNAALQALRTEGIVKFIAEPRVVTQTGRPAFFRSGGQQPVVSQTSGITGPGSQLVPFGTELEVLPIVYANGQIWLEISPRVTAVNRGLAITVGGATTPGFDEQQVRTAVMLESGQTFAIGGLIQNSVRAVSNKVPVLGDLPYVGIGFSRVEHEQTEEELVILVTPRLAGPMNCDQVPKRLPGRETRNPDDYELFLENILEAPRGQRKVWTNRCYNAAWKCDPTAAIFPCVGGVCNGGLGGGVYGSVLGGCATPGPAVGAPVVPPAVPAVLPGGGARVAPGEGESSSLPPVIVVPQVPGN